MKNCCFSLRVWPLLLATLVVFFTPQARAQFTFASDDASQSAYSDGWESSDNGGFGLGGWTLASGGGSGGFGGNFIGDPNAASITTFGSTAFGQFANPTGSGAFANADRSLASAMQVGDTFSFQWAINFDLAPVVTKVSISTRAESGERN